MGVKHINIQKLLDSVKKIRNVSEEDLPKAWSRRELVELILYVMEQKNVK